MLSRESEHPGEDYKFEIFRSTSSLLHKYQSCQRTSLPRYRIYLVFLISVYIYTTIFREPCRSHPASEGYQRVWAREWLREAAAIPGNLDLLPHTQSFRSAQCISFGKIEPSSGSDELFLSGESRVDEDVGPIGETRDEEEVDPFGGLRDGDDGFRR